MSERVPQCLFLDGLLLATAIASNDPSLALFAAPTRTDPLNGAVESTPGARPSE